MSPCAVELPDPVGMRGRWAALAAVRAARGWEKRCYARGSLWHYDNGGGSWVQLHHLDRGRAVLIGHDRDYSETYFGSAAEYFDEPETDLLAGAPPWWGPPAREAMGAGSWVGFVYGYADGRWLRADYDEPDGFTSVGLPALSDEDTRADVLAHVADAPGVVGEPSPSSVDALIAADGRITSVQLAAVIGTGGWSVPSGVEAAQVFLAAPC